MELLIWAFLPEERARVRIDQSENESAPINALQSAGIKDPGHDSELGLNDFGK